MKEHRSKELYGPIQVCVDANREGAWIGRFYMATEDEEHPFQDLMQFLREAGRYFDREQPPPVAAPPYDGPPRGKLAAFTIQVLYRQHESWQGTLAWHEGRSTQTFRSVLELIFLMNSALNPAPPSRPPPL